jgi:hypothetical protein
MRNGWVASGRFAPLHVTGATESSAVRLYAGVAVGVAEGVGVAVDFWCACLRRFWRAFLGAGVAFSGAGVTVSVRVGVGVGRGLCLIRFGRGGFSGFAVIRGLGVGVGLGAGVQVGTGVGGVTAVLSGVSPMVGVGVSARTGAPAPPASTVLTNKPSKIPRPERAVHWLEITRSAAVADQTSAGCSAPNERIRASTSSITESGVDAPAVTPMRSRPSNQRLCKSSGRSTW